MSRILVIIRKEAIYGQLKPFTKTQNEPKYTQIRRNTVKRFYSGYFIHYGHIVKMNIRLNSSKIQKILWSSNIKDYALFSAIFNWQKNSSNMAIWSSSMRPRNACSPKNNVDTHQSTALNQMKWCTLNKSLVCYEQKPKFMI